MVCPGLWLLTPVVLPHFYPQTNVGPPSLWGIFSALVALLPVWMTISSLTPWLSDIHTVRFSGSSYCFFVFRLVVIFLLVVWGGQEYLPHLHLGWTSQNGPIITLYCNKSYINAGFLCLCLFLCASLPLSLSLSLFLSLCLSHPRELTSRKCIQHGDMEKRMIHFLSWKEQEGIRFHYYTHNACN